MVPHPYTRIFKYYWGLLFTRKSLRVGFYWDQGGVNKECLVKGGGEAVENRHPYIFHGN